ncbi:MAG: hypothetical protein A2041_00625 [Bacteroidetes bacterium GWA2_31_9b]|nr:MAG: hypothetical protein A2041_00625 [Bacteroidetes bacterium GWA2_31_9b]
MLIRKRLNYQILKSTFYTILIILISLTSFSQNLNNLCNKIFTPYSDSTRIDSLIIIPQSEIVYLNNIILNDSSYFIDYETSTIIFSKDIIQEKPQVIIKYRVFNNALFATYFHRNSNEIITGKLVTYNEKPLRTKEQSFFTDNQLDKRGSISRGITIGNNQDAAISSNLNLQLAGKIIENIHVLAAISDNNIPIQPDGNSQQIQEFDKVFIQLYNKNTKLIAGDFELTKPSGYYMNINRKVQGGLLNTRIYNKKDSTTSFETSTGIAISKGKYCRKSIAGQEGNQGPYKLSGCENELYVIVLAGTENIYINGNLLTRGKENDYTIDYNTGEITFTANTPITKDSRISVEFEYSERSYSRFLISSNNQFKTKNTNLWFNVFTEQDSKNQPLTQDLTNEQKKLLAESGDNTQNAFVLNVDSTEFTSDYVMYLKKDTLVNTETYSIYEYSIDPLKAYYKLGFALVGENKGNYIQTTTSANGRVFKWIAPINGINQGNYEPVLLLIAPKNKQVVSFGGDIKLSKSTHTNFELAASNNDLNTFSDKDASDDFGYALKLGIEKNLLQNDTLRNNLTTSLNYEYKQMSFDAVDRFRPIEFERDWNIQNPINENEQLINLAIDYRHLRNIFSNYEIAYLKNSSVYSGIRNKLNGSINYKGFDIYLKSSLLRTDYEINSTQFLRYIAGLSKSTKHFKIGIENESEKNEWNNTETDSLLINSFHFSAFRVYIENPDSSINKYSITYINRNDYLPKNNLLKNSTRSNDFQIGFGLLKNPSQTIRSKLTYRTLEIIDTSISTQTEQNTLTGRIEYNFRLFRNTITSSLFYEAGSGLEPKREYSYLRVATGQGIFAWVDYNSNGIAELDEFEIAQFQDQANFIRIFTPGTEYIKTYSNEFSQVLNIRPEAVWKSKKGTKKFVSRFSDQFAYQLNQKSTNTDLTESLNPFNFQSIDSTVITQNQSFRNTFSFNKTNSKLGIDYIYQYNKNKLLLTNGFDDRNKFSHGLKFRWLFYDDFILQNFAEIGTKKYTSEYFSSKNYSLSTLLNELSLQYSPGFQTKIEIKYSYNDKSTAISKEHSTNHAFGTEINYSITDKGNIQLKAKYLKISYNSEVNTSLAYEMLDGLKPGNNATWDIAFQQKLAGNIELTLFYSGRVSENISIIHTGSLQLRAFF